MFKKLVKDEIKKEQQKVTDMIVAKLTIPNMSAVKERELVTQLYDCFESVIGEVLDTL